MSFENQYIKFWVEETILFSYYKPGYTIDMEIAKSCVAYRLKHYGYQDYLCLMNVSDLKLATTEALSYLASHEAVQGINAMAFLTDQTVSKMIINIMLKSNTFPLPSAIFEEEHEAIHWLSSLEMNPKSSM